MNVMATLLIFFKCLTQATLVSDCPEARQNDEELIDRVTMPLPNISEGQGEPGIESDGMADDLWREAVALKRYRFNSMMLIGDEPQSYPSYR
jgi:hypothetical protein